MDTFNNSCNGPGEPPKCLQCVADSFRTQEDGQDRGHLAAWSELREVYHKLQLPVGCPGIQAKLQFLGGKVRSFKYVPLAQKFNNLTITFPCFGVGFTLAAESCIVALFLNLSWLNDKNLFNLKSQEQ